jgi:DNA repair exonuclease SbcCD ATPase subunit
LGIRTEQKANAKAAATVAAAKVETLEGRCHSVIAEQQQLVSEFRVLLDDKSESRFDNAERLLAVGGNIESKQEAIKECEAELEQLREEAQRLALLAKQAEIEELEAAHDVLSTDLRSSELANGVVDMGKIQCLTAVAQNRKRLRDELAQLYSEIEAKRPRAT